MNVDDVQNAMPMATVGPAGAHTHVGTDAGISAGVDVDDSPVLALGDPVEANHPDSLSFAIAKGIKLIASERAERLVALAQALRGGAYYPVASDLADQLIAHAELEARLAG